MDETNYMRGATVSEAHHDVDVVRDASSGPVLTTVLDRCVWNGGKADQWKIPMFVQMKLGLLRRSDLLSEHEDVSHHLDVNGRICERVHDGYVETTPELKGKGPSVHTMTWSFPSILYAQPPASRSFELRGPLVLVVSVSVAAKTQPHLPFFVLLPLRILLDLGTLTSSSSEQ